MHTDLIAYISQLSTSMATQNVASAVNTAMLSKTMDAAEAEGARLVESLEQLSPSMPNGVGSLLDVRA